MKQSRRALAVILVLGLVLMLSGCGTFGTRMARAIQKMSRLHDLQVELYADLELELRETEGDMVLPLHGGLEAKGNWYTRPFELACEATLTLPGSMNRYELYAEDDGNAVYLYSKENDGTQWTKQGFTSRDLRVNGLKYIVEAAGFFEEQEVEMLDGVSARRYDGSLSSEFLDGLMSLYKIRELFEDEMGIQLAENLLTEPKEIPASVWLDEESAMIVRVDADLSDFAADLAERQLEDVREAVGLDRLGLELGLTGLKVSVRLSQFDNVGEFEIPDEARAAWKQALEPWE